MHPVERPVAPEQASQSAAIHARRKRVAAYLYHDPIARGAMERGVIGGPSADYFPDIAQAAITRLVMSDTVYSNETDTIPPEIIYTTARNISVDSWRSSRIRPQTVGLAHEEYADRFADQTAPDHGEQIADRAALEQAIEKLPAEHGPVIRAIYFQGMTQTEAAQALGIPLGTVKSRVHYALNNMRRRLLPDLTA